MQGRPTSSIFFSEEPGASRRAARRRGHPTIKSEGLVLVLWGVGYMGRPPESTNGPISRWESGFSHVQLYNSSSCGLAVVVARRGDARRHINIQELCAPDSGPVGRGQIGAPTCIDQHYP